ncbi:uncharacterized protein zbbx isoform X2 [Mastacembelus armatus]|uniref:Zinc finger, B-box domain containing n=1 Tax=Mastacembelus armatus TaxID=205130 RepID=A0A3Q3LAR9_9TELE|nr:zinc finger B-box domain-containing protein 1 isoform X2 [Mastacembelus armatus]
MNLNDFVVLPNNKARSVKLSARNLQELHVETVTLAQESKEMEEKLQQLKESMSREKEERGHSGGFRWKSGQSGSLNSNILKSIPKKNKENRLQKLSAGKVKIQVLKDEPLTASPQPLPPPPAPSIALPMTRKNRLRGTICGQCEVKTAGLMCAECTENYCVGCFAKFHQKGALKLHRMIPIQTDLRTHVSTQDVVSSFQKQMNPVQHQYYPSTSAVVNPSPDSQLNYNHTFMSSERTRHRDLTQEKGREAVTKPMQFYPYTSQLFVVNHGEEKMVEMTEGHPKSEDENGFSTSLLSGVYNEEESARSFQEAVRQWRLEKNDGAEEPMNEEAMWIPFQPVSVSAIATQADLPPDRGAEGRGNGGGEGRVPVKVKFTENNLTYMDRLLLKKHRRTPFETYHTSMALDTDLKSLPNTSTEEDTAGTLTALAAKEEDFRRYCASLFAVPVSRGRIEPLITTPESCLVIHVLDEIPTTLPSKGRTLVPQTTFSLQAAQPEAAQKLHTSKPQTSRTEQSVKSLPSKSKPLACSTAETPRTSKASIMAPTSKSQKSNVSPIALKSKDDHGSPQLLSSLSLPHSQNEIPKFSHSPPTFSATVSLVQNGSDSSLLPEPHSPQLFPEKMSYPKLSQSPLCNVESPEQSQHLLCVPELLPIGHELEHHLSLESSKPNPQSQSLEPSASSLFLFTESPPDVYSRYKSSPEYMDAPVFMSSTPTSGDQETTLSHQDTGHSQSLPLHLLNPIQNPPADEKTEMEEIGVLSIDSPDEMSSDSLGLAQNEGDTSDEETQIYRHLKREEQENLAISHLGDSFVTADKEQEINLQTDEPEQLVEPSMMMYNQCARPESEQLHHLGGLTPLDLDLNSGHSNKPEHAHCDPQHTCQTLLHDSDPAGSKAHGPHSSRSAYSEEHLAFRLMQDSHMQPTGIKSHSTTHTRRGEISASALQTSACLSYPMLGSDLGPAFRPLSRAAREIMEICNVDQTGCEDPDLDTDTTAHALDGLEQELRLIAKETATKTSVTEIVNSGIQDRQGNLHLTKGHMDEEAKEEEEAKQRDWESVLLLP